MALPVATKAGGSCLGMPDVCNVPAPPAPPIPTPFPNTGMLASATKTCEKVQIECMDVVVETSEIATSSGDEAGTLGGLVSGTFAQKVVFKMGSAKVKAEGKGLAYQSATTAHNGSNPNMPAGLHQAPSQSKVSVSP